MMKRFFEKVARQEREYNKANPDKPKKFKVSIQTVSCNIVSAERKDGDGGDDDREIHWQFPPGKPFWNCYGIELIGDAYVVLEGGIAIAFDKIVSASVQKV